jgi:hypothetical protein
MAKPWSETKSLALIFSLALVIALPSVSSISKSKIMEDVQTEDMSASTDRPISFSDSKIKKINREPASVNNAELNSVRDLRTVDLNSKELKVLYVDCGKEISQFEDLSSSSVRLRFDQCSTKSGKHEIKEIVNKTNGFTAQLFRHKEVWSTDYIDLSAGDNEIEIRYVNKSGKTESRFLHLTHIKEKD